MVEADPQHTSRLLRLLDATCNDDGAALESVYADATAWRCVDAEPQRLCFSRDGIAAQTRELVALLPRLEPTLGLVLECDAHAIAFCSARDASRRLYIARHCRFDREGHIAEDSLFIDFGTLHRKRRRVVRGIETLTARRTIVATGSDVESRNLERMRAYYDAVNHHHDGHVAAHYLANARLIDPNSGEVVRGRKEIVRSFVQIWEALPAHRAEPMRFFAAGDYVAAIHVVMLDPPRVDPSAPTPRQLEELVLFEIADDRIASEWTFFNSTRLDRT